VATPPYCRSLDPAWRDAYVEDIDQELADLIARQVPSAST
jgi:hypothetical protein